MKSSAWSVKSPIMSPAATPSSPSSVRTRTRVSAKLARGLLSHETGTGGSRGMRWRLSSIAAIFMGQRRSRRMGISGASAGGIGKSQSLAGHIQQSSCPSFGTAVPCQTRQT